MALRLAKLLALSAFGFACAFAQEKSAPTNAATQPGAKTIDDAKRDFQALKASRAGPEQNPGTLALPKVELPGVTTEILAPTGAAKNGKKEKRAQQKSQNWLLDAMALTEKSANNSDSKDRKRSANAPAPTAFTDELTDDADENPLSGANVLREQAAQTEKNAPIAKDAPILDNPLTPFMTGWISPRDHEVLLSKTSATPMLDASLAQMVDSPGTSLAPVSTSGPAGGFLSLPTPAPTLSENPYLRADLPTLAAPPQGLPSPALSLPAATLLPELKSPLVEPVAPAKPAPPPIDPRKPPQDEKYFPQLKRF